MADPTESLADQYKSFVEATEQLDKLTTCCTSLANLVIKSDDATTAEKEFYGALVPEIEEAQAKRQLVLEQSKKILAESEAVRKSREDKLDIPDEQAVSLQDLNVKDLKSFVGTLDHSNASNIKAFFCRLFQYGKTVKYSHSNYQAALAACFQGTLLDQYFALEKTNMKFKEMAEWFYQIYYRPQNLRTFEEEMRNFQRLANEPLDVFLKRFQIVAEQADALLPSNQAYYTTDRHKLKIIEKVIQPPAKLEYLKWRGQQDDGGISYSFEKSVREATDLERYANCIPNANIAIDTLDVVTVNYMQLNTSTPTAEANPAIKSKRFTSKANANPYGKGKSNIDPQRAGGPRATFYPSRSQSEPKQNPSPGGSQKGDAFRPSMSRNFKFSSRGSRGRGGFNRGSSRGSWRQGNRGGRASSEPAQFSYSNPSDYTNMQRSSQPSYTNQGNRGGYRGGRGSYRGNRRNSGNFSNSRNNTNQVRKNWFCLKCGVYPDVEKTKRIGSTHTTRFCPMYRHFNNEFCSYCLGTKGLRANHHPKHCLQMPPQGNHAETEHSKL